MVISLLRYYLTDYIGVYRTRVASLKSTASRLKVYNDPYIPPSILEDASKEIGRASWIGRAHV